MSTPTYNEISIESVIARAKLQLRLIDNSNDDYLEILIGEGLDSMDCASQLIKRQCEIEVCDRTAKLPVGFVKFLALRFDCDSNVDPTNDPIQNQLFNRLRQFPMVYADTTFLNQCGIDCNSNGSFVVNNFTNTFQINKGHIHFNFDPQVDTITLAFLGLNVNEFGKTLIYQRYERALAAYACYQFAMAFKEEYTNYIVENYNRTWIEQRNKIIGSDYMNNFSQDRFEISALMNGLMVSRNRLLYP